MVTLSLQWARTTEGDRRCCLVCASPSGKVHAKVRSGQALGELRKLKQGKLSIDRYIEKYQSLVQKSHNVYPDLQYQWFLAGQAPGERQSVTARAADRERKGEVIGLDTMVQFLRMKGRRNATATALTDKGELLGGGNPDLEPMDVEAVVARAAMRRSEDRGEATTRGSIAGRPRSDPCKKPRTSSEGIGLHEGEAPT